MNICWKFKKGFASDIFPFMLVSVEHCSNSGHSPNHHIWLWCCPTTCSTACEDAVVTRVSFKQGLQQSPVASFFIKSSASHTDVRSISIRTMKQFFVILLLYTTTNNHLYSSEVTDIFLPWICWRFISEVYNRAMCTDSCKSSSKTIWSVSPYLFSINGFDTDPQMWKEKDFPPWTHLLAVGTA